ncbi:MAG: hypothetical protein ACSHX3_03935 [Litorimonas sp.]
MKIASALIGTAALLVLPQAAFASNMTVENISTCKAEIETRMAETASETSLDFKKVKGNSRAQTLSFRIDADGEKDTVKCKVRRDDTVEIKWGKSVQPKMVKAVQAEESMTAGE